MKVSEQLRKSILQAAIQGKLTEQHESDGSAYDLLQEIKAEKDQLIKDKVIKKSKALAPITDDEVPFDIPENWVFMRLGEVGLFRKGPFGSSLTKAMFVPNSETSVKVYEQKNAIQKDWKLGEYFITEEYFEKMKGFEVGPNDIIISCAGTIGEVYKIPSDAPTGIINQALMRVRLFNNFSFDYFRLVFNSILGILNEEANGTAIKNIPPFSILNNIVIPLPPLAEQQRIVGKIEELLPELDKLREQEEIASKTDTELPEKLRKSFLQAAMQGKLTEQLESDGTAYDLLEQIRAEKEQLIKDKKIKKEKPLTPITDEEIPFDIPENWAWVRLGDVFNRVFSNKSPKYSQLENSNLVLGQRNNQEYGIDLNNIKFATDEFWKSTDESMFLAKYDVLLNTLGGGTVGRTGLFMCDGKYLTDGHLFIFRSNLISLQKYLYYYLKLNKQEIEKNSSGSTNQTFLKLNDVKNYVFPLPPLAEQQRIVEKLDILFDNVDLL